MRTAPANAQSEPTFGAEAPANPTAFSDTAAALQDLDRQAARAKAAHTTLAAGERSPPPHRPPEHEAQAPGAAPLHNHSKSATTTTTSPTPTSAPTLPAHRRAADDLAHAELGAYLEHLEVITTEAASTLDDLAGVEYGPDLTDADLDSRMARFGVSTTGTPITLSSLASVEAGLTYDTLHQAADGSRPGPSPGAEPADVIDLSMEAFNETMGGFLRTATTTSHCRQLPHHNDPPDSAKCINAHTAISVRPAIPADTAVVTAAVIHHQSHATPQHGRWASPGDPLQAGMANFQKKARQSTTDHRRGQPPPVNDSTTAYFVNGVCHHPRGVRPDIDFNDWGPAQRPDWDPAWVFTFGKHKGKRLPEVQEAYPAYVQWLIRQRIYLNANRAELRRGLEKLQLIPITTATPTDSSTTNPQGAHHAPPAHGTVDKGHPNAQRQAEPRPQDSPDPSTTSRPQKPTTATADASGPDDTAAANSLQAPTDSSNINSQDAHPVPIAHVTTDTDTYVAGSPDKHRLKPHSTSTPSMQRQAPLSPAADIDSPPDPLASETLPQHSHHRHPHPTQGALLHPSSDSSNSSTPPTGSSPIGHLSTTYTDASAHQRRSPRPWAPGCPP